MFRIDSVGAVEAAPSPAAEGDVIGYFTEGDPQNAVPATVVSKDWLNSVQEEILAPILAAAIVPAKATRNQLLAAIRILAEASGKLGPITVANNQSVAANLGGAGEFLFAGSDFRAVTIEFAIYRKDDGSEVAASGTLRMHYKPGATSWDYFYEPSGDDSGVELSVTSGGQVQYTSSNFSGGGTYTGQLRAKITKYAV